MPVDRLRLRRGVDPQGAILQLRELVDRSRDALQQASLPGGMPAMRDHYLDWVQRVEMTLRNLSFDPAPITGFHTARYWHIRALEQESPRAVALVDCEIEFQVAALRRLLDDLQRRAARYSGLTNDTQLAILDTNALLQYLPPWQIPWPELLQRPDVRLVTPLRVIEELDAKIGRAHV